MEYGKHKMATAKETTLYLRNARPNRIVFNYDGVRYRLEHRGNRADSVALSIKAKDDPEILRWIRIGQLEEIGKEAFMQLGKRAIDVLPNEFLKRDVRNNKSADLSLMQNKDDASGSKLDVDPKEVTKKINDNSRPQWAGDLMTTEEELESGSFEYQSTDSYPSRHRDR